MMATFRSPRPEHLNSRLSIGSTLHVYCQVLIIFCRPTGNNRRLTPELTTVERGMMPGCLAGRFHFYALPCAALAGENCGSASRTTSTGHGACRTTLSVVLPS